MKAIGADLDFRLTKFSPLAVASFVTGAAVMLMYRPFLQMESGDNAIWDYIAQSILRGQVPYRDVVENKSPGSAYLSALVMYIGRFFGLRDIIAVRLFYVVLVGLLCAATYLVAERYLRSRVAGIIAALIPLMSETFAMMLVAGTRPKLPMILFGMVCLYLIAIDRPFWAGLFSMLACVCWQPGLLFTGVAFLIFSRYLMWLRERFQFREVYGVDLSPHASMFWQTRGIDTAALATADRLPFPEAEFDLVTCFDVIYQLNDERASAAISEMNRLLLRPGGLLFIREPAYQWMRGAHDAAVGTDRRYTLTDLRRLLLAHGFKIRRATYANTLLFWLAAPHRLLSKLRGSTAADVRSVPGWLNTTLAAALELEARMLARFHFPFGMSAIALAQKDSR